MRNIIRPLLITALLLLSINSNIYADNSNNPKEIHKTEQGISEQLAYSTTRLEVQFSNGTSGTATGFFFRFQKSGFDIPVIITNKHVINGRKT